MRITQKLMMKTQTRLLSKNYEKASKRIEQISSGKKYSKISENPVDISRALALRSKIDAADVYSTNIERAVAENDVAELSILDVQNSIQRIKEIISNNKLTENIDGFEASKQEIEQVTGTLVSQLNVKYNDNYIFGGSLTKTPPFQIVNDANGIMQIQKDGNDDLIQVEIADNVYVNRNIASSDLFTYDGGTTTLSTTINNILTDFENDDFSNMSTYLNELNNHESNVLTNLSKVGAKTDRYENMLETHENISFKIKERLSTIEDTEIDVATVEFTQYQMAYEASVSAIQKLSNLSLMNLLR